MAPPQCSTLFPYTTLFRSPESAADRPSTLWGLTYVVDDIDATAAFFGDRTAPVKAAVQPDRKSTRLNSSHPSSSYAVFCLKKKTPDKRAEQSPQHGVHRRR